MLTTQGRELIRQKLPDKYKAYADKVLDTKTTTELMTIMAAEDPDSYVQTLQDLNNIGQAVVSTYGRDAALSFSGLAIDKETADLNKQLHAIIDKILNDDSLTSEQKEEKIKDLGYKYTQKIEDAVFRGNDKNHTSLASQINSRSRGNKVQLMQLQFGNMLMKDALNRDIPYLMVDPYTKGVSPMSYWASASSGRKGFYDVQAATGQSGYLGKMVTAATHDTIISENDCGTTDTGVVFPANSDKNIGAVLLRPFHNYPAGSIVTAKMVAEAGEDEDMVLRSPTTCKSKVGVCAKCNGLAENGKFPGIGEYVSLNAARTFVETMTQAGVGCLHPDTAVRMADWSIRRIADIKVGDTVIGVSKEGELSPVKVTHTFDHGPMPMYLWAMTKPHCSKRALTIAATENHNVLMMRRKSSTPEILPLGVLESKQYTMLPAQSPYVNEEGAHFDEAFLIGLFIGGGNCIESMCNSLTFQERDRMLIAQLNTQYMSKHGLLFELQASSTSKYRVVETTEPEEPEKLPISRIKDLLQRCGVLGQTHLLRELPYNAVRWDAESVRELASGIVQSIGIIALNKKKGIATLTLQATAPIMLKQLADLIFVGCGAIADDIRTKVNPAIPNSCSIGYYRQAEAYKVFNWLKLYSKMEKKRQTAVKILESWYKKTPPENKLQCWSLYTKEYIGKVQALDIEVDHPDHLFLLANGMVVSNSKHKGGVGGKKVEDPDGPDQPTGFDSIERMFLAPSTFPGGAILSPVDGIVSAIQPAPQGGSYIMIGQEKIYSAPERTITVKAGDKIYAGDTLTNGVPNPQEVVQLKGLGEGRKYFTSKLNDLLKKQGWGTDRRNLESFTRAMISKVRITDPDGYGSYLPGEIADYNEIAASYTPREDAVETTPDKALNKYLEKPVLHYSIGTRITPEIAKTLKKYDFNSVTVSDKEPPFTAQFLRPAVIQQNAPGWMPRLAGERLYEGLFDAARKGVTDSYDSPSYVDKIVAAPFKP